MSFIYKLLLSFYSLILSFLPLSTYSEGVAGQPSSFISSQAVNRVDASISHLIYKGLFKYDIYGAIIPDLVETWSISEDGLVYTIKLKDNQYWTDGRKVSSDDLIYTAYKNPDLAGVATDKVDNLTVRYTLPNKYSPFLNLLTEGVIPVNSLEKDNPLIPVSNGDFRVARVERNGDFIRQIVLVTGKSDYNIKKIIFKFYSNEEELLTASKLGEIDAFMSYENFDIQNFQNHKFPSQGIFYALFFNLRNDKFSDVELRRKLEKVLPIDKLVTPYGIEVQGPISRSFFTDKALNFNNYDETFKEDLDLSLTITAPDMYAHRTLAREIGTIWKEKLDIEVKYNFVDSQDIVKDVIENRDFEIILYGQEVSRDPDRYVIWHSVQKNSPGLNISGFEQVRCDRALEEGRNELDNDKRISHYNEFQKTLLDNIPSIFLYHPYTNYYVSKYIEGIGDKYTFTYADRFLDFANWKKIRTN